MEEKEKRETCNFFFSIVLSYFLNRYLSTCTSPVSIFFLDPIICCKDRHTEHILYMHILNTFKHIMLTANLKLPYNHNNIIFTNTFPVRKINVCLRPLKQKFIQIPPCERIPNHNSKLC